MKYRLINKFEETNTKLNELEREHFHLEARIAVLKITNADDMNHLRHLNEHLKFLERAITFYQTQYDLLIEENSKKAKRYDNIHTTLP